MTTWRIYNTIDGTDLGEYEASSRADALRMFLADTDDVELAPGVTAERAPDRNLAGSVKRVGIRMYRLPGGEPGPGVYWAKSRSAGFGAVGEKAGWAAGVSGVSGWRFRTREEAMAAVEAAIAQKEPGYDYYGWTTYEWREEPSKTKGRNRAGAVSASNQLDPVLLDYITGAYQGWARAREYSPKAPEPSIGIGELVGYVEQHNVVDTLRKANLYPSDSKYFRKYVRSAVETSVQRLLRQGLLVRSLGLVRSARGTTVHETHVFEPARNGR